MGACEKRTRRILGGRQAAYTPSTIFTGSASCARPTLSFQAPSKNTIGTTRLTSGTSYFLPINFHPPQSPCDRVQATPQAFPSDACTVPAFGCLTGRTGDGTAGTAALRQFDQARRSRNYRDARIGLGSRWRHRLGTARERAAERGRFAGFGRERNCACAHGRSTRWPAGVGVADGCHE